MRFDPTSVETFELCPDEIRDLAPEVLDEHRRLRILPAEYWAGTTSEERALLGHRYGLYGFPTVELVEHLAAFIGARSAIEIGAGHGALARALDIPATDSRQQDKEPYRTIYRKTNQPTVRYGSNIIECDAARAVHRYRPQVVIGCWVTHKYDPNRHEAGGNEVGVDEADLLRYCEHYVTIGNEHVHRNKPIWALPHEIEYPPFVYSRARTGTRDFIAVWRGSRKPR